MQYTLLNKGCPRPIYTILGLEKDHVVLLWFYRLKCSK